MVFERRRDNYTITTDKARLDVGVIHDYLSQISYWAQGRSRQTVERSIGNSLCFGVYEESRQVGFARVVTDSVTFGWLCDVFILPSHQGRGLGKWLVECVTAHPDLQGLKTFLLISRDAHGLYAGYGGFKPLEEPQRWMVRRRSPPEHP
jgi:GNAT superfamily N-acetyltransferase